MQHRRAILKSLLDSIGYSSIFSITSKQYETLIRNHICEKHERRSTRYFLEILACKSSEFYYSGLTVNQKKSLVQYIYGQKLKDRSKWPSSIEKMGALKEIVSNVNTQWSRYQPVECDFDTLYAQPHMYFKWLHFLQKEVEKKALVTEEASETLASKAYVYRKLKELPFTASPNRKQFNSLREQVIRAINSDQPLIFGKKLQKAQPHRAIVLNFVNTVKSRIKDGTFCPAKYTDKHGYRYFSILPIYSFQRKSLQIDPQAFWRIVNKSGSLFLVI